MGTFGLIILMTFIIGVGLAIFQITTNKKHKEEAKGVIQSIPDFNATDTYLSETSGISLSFDADRKKICLIDRNHLTHIYTYDQILQCEVDVDGDIVLKQSTTSTIGRSVLGGILSGGVGAVIGGVTSSKKQKENINSIDLKITINDHSNPIFKINFLNTKTKKGSILYRLSYDAVERWHGIVSGFIQKGNELQPSIQYTHISIADEISKLKDLLDKEVISPEDFEKQKSKLLAR